ncbi:hypothetical protein BKA69DRAFT_1104521 [Paraphysoderma sedebokerense]|nr:hypothetical protein BKA69DRAFT_1104521 [Paraphysoderma sedebokerense]
MLNRVFTPPSIAVVSRRGKSFTHYALSRQYFLSLPWDILRRYFTLLEFKHMSMRQKPDILSNAWRISPEFNYAKSTLLVICTIAVLLNGFLLYRFYANRSKLKNGYLILTSICLGDFLSSCCLSLTSILHTISSELTWEWCQYSGMMITLGASTSGVFALFLSAERYIQIVHSKTFQRNQIVAATGIIWLFLVIMSSVPLFNGSYYEQRPSQTWCFPVLTNQNTEHLPFTIMAHILLWTALTGIPFFYWNIYKFASLNGFKWGLRKGAVTAAIGPTASVKSDNHNVKQSETQLNISQNLKERSTTEQDVLRYQLKLTKRLAVLVLQFYIGWFGLAICFTLETIQNTKISPVADFILGLANVVSWLLNPIIILSLDNQLKVRFCQKPMNSRCNEF